MNVRAGHSTRLYWLLLLAAAAIVPSCGSNHKGSSSGSSPATSANPSVSGDGHFVAFDSNSGNLNTSGSSSGSASSAGTREIFLFDRTAGTTKLLTQGQGAASNGNSSNPVISQDGQWVAFQSTSSNLIGTTTGSTTAGTTAGATTAATTAGTASSTTAGTTGATTTAGTTSASTGSTGSGSSSGRSQIFVTNVASGQTRLVSGSTAGDFGNGDSMNPSISANGQMIAFESDANNMVSGSTSSSASGRKNVFVWNMSSNQVELVSATADGNPSNADSTNPSISADGRFIAFQSAAGNVTSGGTTSSGTTSGTTASTTSGTTAGTIGLAGVMRIFVRDIQGGTTTAITPDQSGVLMNGDSSNPSMNGDGSMVAFESTASNLVTGGTTTSTGRSNIFVWNRATGQSTLASVGSASSGTSTAESNGDSHNPAISSDGHFVAFDSQANNLTGGTTAGGSNVFLKDLQAGTITLVSQPQTGATTAGTTSSSTTSSTTTSGGTTSTTSSSKALASSATQSGSANPSISQDGTWIAFTSDQSGLTSDSTSGGSNVFLANRTSGEIILVTKQATGGSTAGTTSGTTTAGTTTAGTTTAGTTTGATTAGTTAGTTTAGTTTAGTTAGTTGTTVGATTGATGATTGVTGTTR